MAAAMKQNSSTTSHECDMNAMEPLAEKYPKELEPAKPQHVYGSKDVCSNKSQSNQVSEIGKKARTGGSKSTFAYIFIGVAMLICLVWSATLFWFLVRGLLQLIF